MTALERTVPVDFTEMISDHGELDPVAHDLLSLAREAYLLDRSERRGNSPDDRRWHRPMRLTVPVLEPNRWSEPKAAIAVKTLLDWMTDDTWHVDWIPADVSLTGGGQSRIVIEGERDVLLFSGGLDAVAGAALLLPERDLEAVAIFTNRRMQSYQSRTIRELRRARLGSLACHQVHFPVRMGKRDVEPTRRTRGLVFLATGAAMARRQGRNRLVMAENGIGAINLPLTKAQSGVMTSRSAHPKTLKMFESLMAVVTQTQFTIETPLISMTKGEVVRRLPEESRSACTASESCDQAAAGRGRLHGRCGYCSSCLLRRIAFHAADRTDWDHRTYLADQQEDLKMRSQKPEMLWQAATLNHALNGPDPGLLHREFPDLAHIPSDVLDDAQQRRLLARYVDEWRVHPGPLVPRFLSNTPLAGLIR